MTRKTTLSLAASLLLLSGTMTPALARDDQPASQQAQTRPATDQRSGGLVGAIPGGTQQGTTPTVEPLPIIEDEAPAPAVAPSQQVAPSSQQATSPALPALEPELPAAAPRAQLPALGEAPSNQLPALGEAPSNQLPALGEAPSSQLPAFGELPSSELPSLGEEVALPPAQAEIGQVAQSEAQPEKKPGFFKRMWTKVKTFFVNAKNKVAAKIASMRANRSQTEGNAQAEGNAQQDYTPVFDADIHGGE